MLSVGWKRHRCYELSNVLGHFWSFNTWHLLRGIRIVKYYMYTLMFIFENFFTLGLVCTAKSTCVYISSHYYYLSITSVFLCLSFVCFYRTSQSTLSAISAYCSLNIAPPRARLFCLWIKVPHSDFNVGLNSLKLMKLDVQCNQCLFRKYPLWFDSQTKNFEGKSLESSRRSRFSW